MTTKQIIDIVVYVLYGILSIISFVVAVKERAKQKNISKVQALFECIPNAVIKAEEMFGSGNGEKKKEIVMTNLMNIALTSKTKIDYAELDRQVENVVKATKNVNVSSVEETFPESNDVPHTDEIKQQPVIKLCENDGAVVIETHKIGDK